tara:strand:+ start:1034 stop:1459 length:426 start_codon:yes stop_codon:yes gene_type:complete
MFRASALFASASLVLSASPSTAQDASLEPAVMLEPATQAVPVNVNRWKRQIARDFPSLQRFYGLPEMRLGLIVDARGAVTSCAALPLDKGSAAKGQSLCALIVKHARFEPARDAEGNAVRSLFVAQFGKSRAVNATTGQIP